MDNMFSRRLLGRSFLGLVCSLACASWASAQEQVDMRGSVQAPIWTDELGEVDPSRYTLEERAQMIRDYWTVERMESAVPLDLPAMEGVDFVPGSTWKSASIAREGQERTLAEPVLPEVGNAPYARLGIVNGTVYFRHAKNGRTGSCSAAAVNGIHSKRLVATAAHCVHSGPGGTWHQNWKFVPGYSNGSQPYGEFSAVEFHLPHPNGWITYGQTPAGFNHDVAFVVTNNNANNHPVVDVVGGHGIVTNIGNYSVNATIFGYPSNIAGGQYLQGCQGTTSQYTWGGYNFHRIFGCNFGPGSSGGPWLTWYNNAAGIGYLFSVTSFGPQYSNEFIAGPYFGNAVAQRYIMADEAGSW